MPSSSWFQRNHFGTFDAVGWGHPPHQFNHLKNHAFLMDHHGTLTLAPAYDLSFSRGPGGENTTLVAGEGRRPGRTQIDEVAQRSGIKPRRASEIIGEVARRPK